MKLRAKRVSPGVENKLTGVETLSSRHDGVSLVDCASIEHITRLKLSVLLILRSLDISYSRNSFSNSSSHVGTSDSTHQHD